MILMPQLSNVGCVIHYPTKVVLMNLLTREKNEIMAPLLSKPSLFRVIFMTKGCGILWNDFSASIDAFFIWWTIIASHEKNI